MLRNYLVASYLVARIGDKIGVTSENKTIHTPSLSPPFNVGVFCCFLTGSSNSDTTLYGGDGGGKALFSPFKVDKTSERPFRGKVSQLILSLIVIPWAFHNP